MREHFTTPKLEIPRTEEDAYAILNVAQDASKREIKEAFKKLALQYHPDKYDGQDKDLMLENMKVVNIVKKLILDPLYETRYKEIQAQHEKQKAKHKTQDPNQQQQENTFS